MTRERCKEWPTDRLQAMAALVSLFPTLRTASGVHPWNATEFVRWAALHVHGSGSAHAVRFVLSVWNPSTDWREILKGAKPCDEDQVLYRTMQRLRQEATVTLSERLGKAPTAPQIEKELDGWLELFQPFHLAHAVAVWDAKHRAAVSAWIADPFWP